MKEKEYIQKIPDKDDKNLLQLVLDRYHTFQKTGVSTCSNFVSEREVEFLKNSLDFLKVPYHVYLTNDMCERFIIYFGEYDQFVSYYKIAVSSVQHKDVLGALFGSGFMHSMIGDIFLTEEVVYFTNLSKYDFLLETSLTHIGPFAIQLEKILEFPYIPRKYQEVTIFASSLRLDLVVSRLLQMSRSKTLEYMKEKRILVNFKRVSKTYSLKTSDILSIEGVGKFCIQDVQTSDRGKFRIFMRKYC